jgi:hypothetical protein
MQFLLAQLVYREMSEMSRKVLSSRLKTFVVWLQSPQPVCLPSNAHGWLAYCGPLRAPQPPSGLRYANSSPVKMSFNHVQRHASPPVICSSPRFISSCVQLHRRAAAMVALSTDQNKTSRVGTDFGVP